MVFLSKFIGWEHMDWEGLVGFLGISVGDILVCLGGIILDMALISLGVFCIGMFFVF